MQDCIVATSARALAAVLGAECKHTLPQCQEETRPTWNQFAAPQDFSSSGNGFSDFVLETIDLTTFAGNASMAFTPNFSNDYGAREQFFVVSSAEPPATVPEPATLLLVGSTSAASCLLHRRAPRERYPRDR
jgi:hypothetical protein